MFAQNKISRPDYCSSCYRHTGDPLKRLCSECLLDSQRSAIGARLSTARGSLPARFYYVQAGQPLPINLPLVYHEAVREIIANPQSATLAGPSGIGKTTTAIWICRHLLEQAAQQGFDGPLWHVAEGLRWVYASTYCQQQVEAKLGQIPYELIYLRRAPFVVLDDLGAEGSDAISVRAITQLIGSRFDQNMPTIITTGLTHNQIAARYGTGIARRVFEAVALLSWFQEAAE